MKRRSRAGGEPVKGRRPKMPKPKRRNAPKVEIRTKPSPVAEEKEVARLARERDEALEQQTAAYEVLRVISSSPGDLQPVFATMLEKAARICDASFGNVHRWDGETLQLVASHNAPPAFALARPEQGAGSTRTACSGLRLVHGGVRHARSEGGEGVAGGVGVEILTTIA